MCEQLVEDIIETVSMIVDSEEQFEENKRMTEGNQEESKNTDNRMDRRRRVKKNNQGDVIEYMDYLMTAMQERHHEYLTGAKAATDIRMSVKLQYRHFFEGNDKDGGKNLEAFEITPTLGVYGQDQDDLSKVKANADDLSSQISDKEYFKK